MMQPEILHVVFAVVGLALGWYLKHQSIKVPPDVLTGVGATWRTTAAMCCRPTAGTLMVACCPARTEEMWLSGTSALTSQLVDVRSALPAIGVPALVLARAANVIFPVEHTRYLAEHIVGAKYIEFPDGDLLYFTSHADQVLDAIEEFVTGARPLPSPDRFLGTVLFADVAGSTQLAARIGDSRFRELIDGFHQLVGRQLDRYQGRLVDTAGDGALTLFDSPARAIACAEAVRDGVRAFGLQVRAGVHTGEMEHGPGGEVRGIAVHTGARVAALAGPGEILVSRTIRDLVAGAPIRLESRGVYELKGVPGSWEVYAVVS